MLASGDEEVLRTAPPLPDSPRRLRSSTAAPATPAAPAPAPAPALAPASVPAPAPAPVPMDTSDFVTADRPLWIARIPNVYDFLPPRPYSKDTHLCVENYTSGTFRVAFDFGKLTYRVLKETRYFEEDRFFAYLTGVVSRPSASSFGVAAKYLPCLSADVLPASFPVGRS